MRRHGSPVLKVLASQPMEWDADTYQTFRRERELALTDLLARVPLRSPERILDLGCGTGTSTKWLTERFPESAIVAVDSSGRMLAQARTRGLNATWRQAQIETIGVPPSTQLIFANGVMHRVADHRALFPRLVKRLGKGGVFAVQMPFNNRDASHLIAAAVAREGPWSKALKGTDITATPVLELMDYEALLAPLAREIWAWESLYLHRLTGPAPVLEWMRPALRTAVMSKLDDQLAAAFLEVLAEAYAQAYPADAAGVTVFPVRRRFLVIETP